MKKLGLLILLLWALPQTADAAFFSYRQRTAADCTALTDGYAFDLCMDTGDFRPFFCVPTVAGEACDTASEWHDGTAAASSATVGDDSVTTAKIVNGTIGYADLSATNSPTANYCLTFDGSNSKFLWAECSSSSTSPFTTSSNVISNTTVSTDNMTIGSTTNLGKLGVDGDTDEIQFVVQGNATQTSNLVVFEQSDGTDVATVTNAGNVYLLGNSLQFEGATANAFEGSISIADVTADRTWTAPDRSGTFILSGDVLSGSLTATMESDGDTAVAITDGTVTEADLKVVDTASDEECFTYESTTGDFEWQACGTGVGTNLDSLGDPSGAGDIAIAEFVQSFSWDSAATAAAYDAFTFQFTHDSTSDTDTQRGLVVERLASSGTATWETLAQIQNNDTDGAVTTGLQLLSAAGLMTTAIDASDAEIGVALAIGANSITATDGGLINLSAINGSGTGEGLILPQATSCASSTAEGQICQDSDANAITVGDGTTARQVNGFMIGAQANNAATADLYVGVYTVDASATEGSVDEWKAPIDMTCTGFSAKLSTNPGAGTSYVATLRADGVNSTVTCSMADTNNECLDSTHTATFAAGDQITVLFDETGSAATSARIAWGAFCWPNQAPF